METDDGIFDLYLKYGAGILSIFISIKIFTILPDTFSEIHLCDLNVTDCVKNNIFAIYEVVEVIVERCCVLINWIICW